MAFLNKFFLCCLLFFAFSCGSDNKEVTQNKIDKELLDPNNSIKTAFDGKIFSIPSPFQMSILLNETVKHYSPEFLHDPMKVEKYSTEYSQALALGIYSADLAYTCVNNQNNSSLNILASIEALTDKLRLNSIFDKSFLVRFERNKNNLDSSLVILTEAFRKSDNYLKNDKRKEISALILIGGWVETLHFATNINLIEKNEKVIHHIGEQKETIATILEILKTYNYTKEVRGLTIDFNELKFYFEQVKTVYSYMQPVTNANEKKTTLRHTLTINIDDKLMYDIAKKSEELRDKIIKQNF